MYQFSRINFKKCGNYGHSIKFVQEVYDNFFAPLYSHLSGEKKCGVFFVGKLFNGGNYLYMYGTVVRKSYHTPLGQI